MTRLRRGCALTVLVFVAAWFPVLSSEEPKEKEKKVGEKPAEQWLLDRSLTVSPQAAPVPALKYRLFPISSDRKDGNAAPIYLRFAHERNDERKKRLREKPEAWNQLPLEKLPLAEVKSFLDSYKYNFHQLELGARRKSAEWNYTFDAGNPIGLLLPDAQEMRMHAPLLVLKARVEIVEGRYADTLRTLETGFSFSQQVSEGPFLISALVGIAMARQFADCLLELIERPKAPNLYWALTVIPRPFVDLRRANEIEQKMLEMQFPDMAGVNRPRSAEEWDAALRRVRQELERISRFDRDYKAPPAGNAVTDPASKSPDLPEARRYLADVVGLSSAAIKSMPPSQILLLYLSHYYHEKRDEAFKSTYLPFAQARQLLAAERKRAQVHSDTEAARVANLFLPAVTKVELAQVRIERKLAALRAIEALRMHAAGHAGQLPDKLAQVAIVPVPNDPGTGQPFEYQRQGQSFTLISRIPGEDLKTTGLRYRVTMRK